MINAELVRPSYVYVIFYPPDAQHDIILLKLQREVKDVDLGLWEQTPKGFVSPDTVEKTSMTIIPFITTI